MPTFRVEGDYTFRIAVEVFADTEDIAEEVAANLLFPWQLIEDDNTRWEIIDEDLTVDTVEST